VLKSFSQTTSVEEAMFEAIPIDTNENENFNDIRGSKVARDSVDVQIGVLKEVALSLLRQLDVIKATSRTQPVEGRSLHDEVREFEIELINSALARTHGHQRKAAGLLGLKVTTLNAKMKRYNIMSRFYMPIGEMSAKH
jgi:DNA-binding NtrC family response regulator